MFRGGDSSYKLSKYKENKERKKLLYLFLNIFLLILTVSYFYKSYALYEEKKNFDAINATVEEAGDIYFAYYVDGTISRSMPNQNTGYTLDNEKSSCTNGVSINWNNSTWQGVTDYTHYNATTNTRTKCTLYFNKTSKTISTALGNLEVNSYMPDFMKSACDDDSCESHEKGLFETTDYDGNPTYYYRGSVENNYVKFAGYYWRIIRINSNGSIRMIYDGTSAHDNGKVPEDRYYQRVSFNHNSADNMYVGYMYTLGEVHGTDTSSTIKMANDQFYVDKLLSYASKLDVNADYCGDRSSFNTHADVGINNTITYYKSNTRFNRGTPNLLCENDSDYYTSSVADTGNKKLNYPIGLISLDEAVFAGYAAHYYDRLFPTPKNVNGYLSTTIGYWTMSPSRFSYLFNFSGKGALVYDINCEVGETYSDANALSTLRPVINIRSDVTITGSGIQNDPYLVN